MWGKVIEAGEDHHLWIGWPVSLPLGPLPRAQASRGSGVRTCFTP
jgi:hypothetical protein